MKNIKYFHGKRVGELTVIKRVENYKNLNETFNSQYLCLCSCGKYCIKTYESLRKERKLLCDECYLDKKDISYKGINYKHISELAKELNLDYKLIIGRIHRGWSLEKAIETPINKNKKIIKHKNKEYSIKELSNKTNLSYKCIQNRLSQGWSIEKILETPNIKESYNHYTYNGITGTAQEIARKLGKNPSLIKTRINQGWSIKDAIEKPKKYNYKDIYEYQGYSGTIDDIIKHFDLELCRVTVRNRLKAGATLEEALDGKKKETFSEKMVKIKGESKSVKEWCDIIGIKVYSVYDRLKAGFSLEEALTLPKGTRSKDKEIIYNETHYQSYAELCKDYNIKYCTFKNRLNNGYSLKEALEALNMNYKVYTYKNKKYNGLRKLSEVTNINENVLYKGLKSGKTIEEIINNPKKEYHKYNFKGYYGSIQEIINKFNLNVSYSTVRTRIKNGVSINDAFKPTS